MSLFIFISANVPVIVRGQPTTDDGDYAVARLAIGYTGGVNSRQDQPQIIDTVVRLETQLADLVDKSNMLEAEVDNIQAPLANFVAENGTLYAKLAELEAIQNKNLANLVAKNNMLETKVENLKASLANFMSENGTLEEKLADLEARQDAKLANLVATNEMLEAKLTNMEAKLVDFMAANDTLKAEIAILEDKLSRKGPDNCKSLSY